MKFYISTLFLLFYFFVFSQHQTININAILNSELNNIDIEQKISYINNSKNELKNIYLHNWTNAYKDNKTPLSKRFLEDHDKSFYFAKANKKGFSRIHKITTNKGETLVFNEDVPDIIKVTLTKPLKTNDTIKLICFYNVKIPSSEFTAYGKSKNELNLRYWYLTPAVYIDKWKIMSNLNLDDLFENSTNFKIDFKIPNNYSLTSDLNNYKMVTTTKTSKNYYLEGKNRNDIEINISKTSHFENYKTTNIEIISNLKNDISNQNATSILDRQINFITEFLGKYPHKKLMLSNITYKKNPVYGFNQLPKILNPFNQTFEFDIKMFKTLTNKFINTSILTNRREDTWLNDGIQTFLMIKYIEKYYPEITAIGNISKIWGIKSYKLAKINFNEKYPFVYQFATGKHLDQALNTNTKLLSNFNRKIVNKYKAGLGLQYLDYYLGDHIIKQSLKKFYRQNKFLIKKSNGFKTILLKKTNKNLNWFFDDYLTSNKKIDYTIKKVTQTKDSLKITIKNKNGFTVPILVYGIKNKKIQYKQWFENISKTKTITIKKNNFDKIALNYQYQYPEINLRNNWKNVKPKLFNRPIQFRLFKDIENPFYNQVFYNVSFSYNYYDGLIIGPELYNKSLFSKKWLYKISPTFGSKTKQLTGSFSLKYEHYFKNSSFRRIRTGLSASNYHYAPELQYTKFTPYISLQFNRKNLRGVASKHISARYVFIDKEPFENTQIQEEDNYQVLNLRYSFFNPKIINYVSYFADFQIAKKFSKLSLNLRYRKLTKNKQQLDFRVYAGTFLFNNTTSSFFDFSLNKPSDYLFDYNYLGRSEVTGFLSQQFIEAEGGFKSFFNQNTANNWLLATNNSVSIWRWVEIYGDAGFYKNNSTTQFKYDSGIRFNFIHNFLEIYLPIQSSNGFEPTQQGYSSKIRYVITLSPGKIYNFIKRGFY